MLQGLGDELLKVGDHFIMQSVPLFKIAHMAILPPPRSPTMNK
jgi:hypothetical protein